MKEKINIAGLRVREHPLAGIVRLKGLRWRRKVQPTHWYNPGTKKIEEVQ
jgi:hypothetical protein